MARNFEQITSRMSREQREVQEDVNPKRSRPAKTTAGSTQGGRRADPNMSQINTSIPTELKAKVFYHLKAKVNHPGAPGNLGELLEELLEEWAKKQGGTP